MRVEGVCVHARKQSSRGCWDCYNKRRQNRRCSIDGCERPHLAKGWCQAHYGRWRRNGDPLAGRSDYIVGTIEERFWPKVSKRGALFEGIPCWPWTGGKGDHGYGVFNTGTTLIGAHRQAYELGVGPIPDGLTIDHRCRNRSCVNPAHLEAVTQAENNRRARPTHCKRGHEYTDINMYVRADGMRMCRPCARERSKRRGSTGSLSDSTRRAVLERDNWTCAYCGGPAKSVDHVVPLALRRRHGITNFDQRFLVAACLRDNVRKYTRRLAPPSWADRLHELPGKGWQVWAGGRLPEVIK